MKDNRDLVLLLVAMVVAAFVAFCITTRAFCDWRPRVSEWAKVTVPHWAAPIEIAKRVVWKGVEYDCTLVERESD